MNSGFDSLIFEPGHGTGAPDGVRRMACSRGTAGSREQVACGMGTAGSGRQGLWQR